MNVAGVARRGWVGLGAAGRGLARLGKGGLVLADKSPSKPPDKVNDEPQPDRVPLKPIPKPPPPDPKGK